MLTHTGRATRTPFRSSLNSFQVAHLTSHFDRVPVIMFLSFILCACMQCLHVYLHMSVWVFACVCLCICVCMYMLCICVFVYMCFCVFVFTCVCLCVCCKYVSLYICLCVLCLHVCTHVCLCIVCLCVCMCVWGGSGSGFWVASSIALHTVLVMESH